VEDKFLGDIITASAQAGSDSNLKNDQVIRFNVDLSHLLNKESLMDYFYYLGSLTLPPCSNGKLNWVVSNKIFKMSKEQRKFFDERYNNNKTINGNWRRLVERG
jgi:carbonic anhydrase